MEEGLSKNAPYLLQQKAMNSTGHSFPNAGGSEVSLKACRAADLAIV